MRIRINSTMKEEDLMGLLKNFPKGRRPKRLILKIDGERYPEREMAAEQICYLVGINGEIVLK